jgi:hypothetical protein
MLQSLKTALQKLHESIKFEIEFISYSFSITFQYLKNVVKTLKLRTIRVVRTATQKIGVFTSFQKSSKKHVSTKTRQIPKNSLKFKKAARKSKNSFSKKKPIFNLQSRKAVKAAFTFIKNNSTSWSHFKKKAPRKSSRSYQTGHQTNAAKGQPTNQDTLGQRLDVVQNKGQNKQTIKLLSDEYKSGHVGTTIKPAIKLSSGGSNQTSNQDTLGQRSDVKPSNASISLQIKATNQAIKTRSQKTPASGTKTQQNPKNSGNLRLKKQPLTGYAARSQSIKRVSNPTMSLQHLTLLISLTLLGATAIVVSELTKPQASNYSFDYVTDSRTNELIYFINPDGTGYISMSIDEAEKRLIASGKREAIYPLRVLANCRECLINNQENN